MEIIAQASALGGTLPEALRSAGELGVGVQVWLQSCRDTLMVTLAGVQFVPHAVPDWKEFTLDELRSRFLVDQHGHLIPSDRIPDSRPLSRPMPLQELLVRWRHYQSRCFYTRLLLNAGRNNYAELVAQAVDRSGIAVEHVVYGTDDVSCALHATKLYFRTVLTLAICGQEGVAPERLSDLHSEFPRKAMPAIGCASGVRPPNYAMGKAPWRLFVTCSSAVDRDKFAALKDEPEVEAVICPDPVLALMA